MSRFWQLSVGFAFAVLGCSNGTQGGFEPAHTGSTTGAASSTSESTSDGASNASTGTPAPDPPPDTSIDLSECAYAFATPDESRIIFDVSIDCPNLDLGRAGIAVANTDDEAFVTATHEGRLAVFRVTTDGVVPVPPHPMLFAEPPPLRVANTDTLVLASSDFADEPQEHTVWSYADDWSAEASFSTQTSHRAVGLDSLDDRIDLWLHTNVELRAERRSSEEGWVPNPVSTPAPFPAAFGLDIGGAPVAATVLERPGGWVLSVDGDDVYRGFGRLPRRLWLAPDANAALPSNSPRYVLMTAPDDELLVVFPSEDALEVPGTRAVRRSCTDLPCDKSCVERDSGRFGDSAAVARSADGAVWVSHVHADLDLSLVRRVIECGPVGTCECRTEVTADETTLELRLTVLRRDGSIEPQPPLLLPGVGADAPTDHDLLAMSVGVDNLAIVTRTSERGLRAILLRP